MDRDSAIQAILDQTKNQEGFLNSKIECINSEGQKISRYRSNSENVQRKAIAFVNANSGTYKVKIIPVQESTLEESPPTQDHEAEKNPEPEVIDPGSKDETENVTNLSKIIENSVMDIRGMGRGLEGLFTKVAVEMIPEEQPRKRELLGRLGGLFGDVIQELAISKENCDKKKAIGIEVNDDQEKTEFFGKVGVIMGEHFSKI